LTGWGLGLLHPLIPWDPQAASGFEGRKVLVTAGKRDPVSPWSMSERLIVWFGAQGAEMTAAIHDGGHELRQTEVDALAAFFQGYPRQLAV